MTKEEGMTSIVKEVDQSDYQGWTNRQTWSVALNISNDYNLYMAAVDYVRKNTKSKNLYRGFVQAYGLTGMKTSEGYVYLSNKLNYTELNRFMKGLI
jgi:hypothetical protein